MLIREFENYIKKYGLFAEGDTVIAAVSGGADSMCLLHLLSCMNVRVICAHVNHGIREDASDDEEFVRSFCKKNNIEFKSYKADVRKLAKEKGISEEMAGREIRYKFFFELMDEYNASAIATAHNKNDLGETMLLNLIRGSGMSGLSGFAPKRGDGVVHPLSDISRDRIEEHLTRHGISWCEDSTNAQTDYTRNKIRHLIMPEILKINPAFVDNAARCAEILRDEDEFLYSLAEECNAYSVQNQKVIIDAKKITGLPVVLAKRAILLAVNAAGIMPDMRIVNDVYALALKNSGKKIPLRGDISAVKQFDSIIISKDETCGDYFYKLPQKGELLISETRTLIIVSDKKIPGAFSLKAGEYQVRKRKNGDRFCPEGMSGSKKLKEFFIDIKLPLCERDKIPVIVCGDEIAAVGDIRRSRNFIGDDIFIKLEKA